MFILRETLSLKYCTLAGLVPKTCAEPRFGDLSSNWAICIKFPAVNLCNKSGSYREAFNELDDEEKEIDENDEPTFPYHRI